MKNKLINNTHVGMGCKTNNLFDIKTSMKKKSGSMIRLKRHVVLKYIKYDFFKVVFSTQCDSNHSNVFRTGGTNTSYLNITFSFFNKKPFLKTKSGGSRVTRSNVFYPLPPRKFGLSGRISYKGTWLMFCHGGRVIK